MNLLASFLHKTRAKFDYYAGGQFLSQELVGTENAKSNKRRNSMQDREDLPKRARVAQKLSKPPRKVTEHKEHRRRIPFSETTNTSPNSFTVGPSLHKWRSKRLSVPKKQAPLRQSSPGFSRDFDFVDQNTPHTLSANTIRKFKPAKLKPESDIHSFPAASRPRLNSPTAPPCPITTCPTSDRKIKQVVPKLATRAIKLIDDSSRTATKYEIFKTSDRFSGNLDGLNVPDSEVSRDNDVQTSYAERKSGQKKSARVLEKTLHVLNEAQPCNLTVEWRLKQFHKVKNVEE